MDTSVVRFFRDSLIPLSGRVGMFDTNSELQSCHYKIISRLKTKVSHILLKKKLERFLGIDQPHCKARLESHCVTVLFTG